MSISGILGAVLPAVGSYFGGPVGGLVGSMVGGAFTSNASARAQADTNMMNIAASREQMDFQERMMAKQQEFTSAQAAREMGFQERMSSTSYQRVVRDLTDAGLNPMLAMHGGESTPAGAAGSSGLPTGTTPPRLESPRMAALTTAMSLSKMAAEIENVQAATDVQRSQALINAVQVPKIEQETRTGAASASQLYASAGKLREEADQVAARLKENIPAWERRVLEARQYEIYSRARVLDEEGAQAQAYYRARSSEAGSVATLRGLEIPLARNLARVQGSAWMRNVSPYLPDVLRSTGSAFGLKRLVD